LTGRVVDENGSPVRDARVTVHRTGPAVGTFEAQSDPTGAFTISLPEPGGYLYSVDHEGFYALKDHPIQVEAPSQELTATINSVREVFQSVNVTEETSPVDLAATSQQERLSGTEINDILYAKSHSLLSSLHLFPEITPGLNGLSAPEWLLAKPFG
jgi:hypothetical protein